MLNVLKSALSHQFNVTEKQVTSVQTQKVSKVDCLNLCYGNKNKTEFRPLVTKLKMNAIISVYLKVNHCCWNVPLLSASSPHNLVPSLRLPTEGADGQMSAEEEEARRIAEMGKPILGEHSRLEVVIEESYEFKVNHSFTDYPGVDAQLWVHS